MCKPLLYALVLLLPSLSLAADVTFPSTKLSAADPGENIKGLLFLPEGQGPHPAVVLLHTCGGLKAHVTHDWPTHLVGQGYVVLTVDTLGSRGYHQGCGPMKDRLRIQARDAYGALDFLSSRKEVDPKRVAAIGFSMGAMAINEVMYGMQPRADGQPDFRAFASLYGRCRGLQANANRNTPLLQIAAELDHQLAPSCVEAAKRMPTMQLVVYSGAHHAFDQADITQVRSDRAGNMMLHDAVTAEKSRVLVSEFLGSYLKGAM